jgi:tetratricopeptide (TPR) repeat protein
VAIEITGTNIEARLTKGLEFEDKGLFDEAINEYKEVLKLDSNNADAHKNLGDAYFEKDLFKEALLEYRASVKINPEYQTYHNLGLLYYFMGLNSEAIKELKEALKFEPDNAYTLSVLSAVYTEKGMPDEGMVTAREAINSDPKLPMAHYSLGIAYHEKELYDDAEKEYKEALKLDPDLDDAKENLELLKQQKMGGNSNSNDNTAEYPYIDNKSRYNRKLNNINSNDFSGISRITNSHNQDSDLRIEIITKLLLENRPDTDTLFWGPLSNKNGQTLNKKDANAFLFFCIFDYQMSANYVWENCEKFIINALGDPDSLWDTIAAYSLNEWMQLSKKYSLHRFPHARERAYRIANDIVKQYNGDARNIWAEQPINIVRERIYDLVGGDAIPRMIMGALKDSGHVKGILDVKPDVHVKTVLGRIFTGRILSDDEATRLTRFMNPEDPWAIDAPLYLLGRDLCQKSKCYCDICYLQRECNFFKSDVKNNWVKGE